MDAVLRDLELRGAYPAILDDPKVGLAATDLFRDAQALLDRIVREGRLRAAGVVGFWPANADGDDIVAWRTRPAARRSPRSAHSASRWPRPRPARTSR